MKYINCSCKKIFFFKNTIVESSPLFPQAEAELQKASIEASRSQHALEQQVDSFESKKIRDMKNILREFINIELIFHAKALELYTQCFQTLETVDPDKDLQVRL